MLTALWYLIVALYIGILGAALAVLVLLAVHLAH